jgi:hypothetical protein
MLSVFFLLGGCPLPGPGDTSWDPDGSGDRTTDDSSTTDPATEADQVGWTPDRPRPAHIAPGPCGLVSP